MGILRIVRAASVSFAVASVTVALASASAVPTFSDTVVAGGPGGFIASYESDPVMDGRYVVYEYAPGMEIGIADSDIKVYDVGTATTAPVTDRAGDDDINQISPDISMDTIVYQSDQFLTPNIFLYNIPWQNERQVTNSAHPQTDPRISGRYIVWRDANTTALMYYATHWPQYMNQQIPGTVGVLDKSWDIDGDTVVFARSTGGGNFTFYKWTIWSDSAPEAFGSHASAGAIADIRLHNGRMTYTYGAGLDNIGVIMLHDGFGGPLASGARHADLFHEMYAYETIADGNIHFMHNEFWGTSLGTAGNTETNPSAFGNRVAYERNTYNGDIVVSTASEPLIDRSAGDTRYETAVAASKRYFRSGADAVVLCTGENFPDALAAAPWARFLKAPVLLTRRASVPQAVMDEITRLGATSVWIVGGETAVSSAVQAQLEGVDLTVDRELQGADRYETAGKIANFLYDAVTADGRPFSGTAFVARGDSFADALSIAPVAAATYSPILLVRTDAPLPEATDNVFEFLPIRSAFIIGGTDVVSEDVEVAIEAWTTMHYGASSPATRMGGDDRYATSATVLRNAVSMNWVDLDTVGIATGLNFPDALGGGAALGTYGSPLLLTRPTALPADVSAALTQHAAGIGRIDIFGGEDVVSEGVRTSIAGLLQ